MSLNSTSEKIRAALVNAMTKCRLITINGESCYVTSYVSDEETLYFRSAERGDSFIGIDDILVDLDNIELFAAQKINIPTAEDIEKEEELEQVLSQSDQDKEETAEVSCPHCTDINVIPLSSAGLSVECNNCHEHFTAPVPEITEEAVATAVQKATHIEVDGHTLTIDDFDAGNGEIKASSLTHMSEQTIKISEIMESIESGKRSFALKQYKSVSIS